MLRVSSGDALERVVSAAVVVPELFASRVVADSEGKPLAGLQLLAGRQRETEPIRQAVTRADNVRASHVAVATPLVRRQPHQHRLVEVDVENANRTANHQQLVDGHRRRFQTHAVALDALDQVGHRVRLTKTGYQR